MFWPNDFFVILNYSIILFSTPALQQHNSHSDVIVIRLLHQTVTMGMKWALLSEEWRGKCNVIMFPAYTFICIPIMLCSTLEPGEHNVLIIWRYFASEHLLFISITLFTFLRSLLTWQVLFVKKNTFCSSTGWNWGCIHKKKEFPSIIISGSILPCHFHPRRRSLYTFCFCCRANYSQRNILERPRPPPPRSPHGHPAYTCRSYRIVSYHIYKAISITMFTLM